MSDASLRAGMLLDLADPSGRSAPETSSVRCWRAPTRSASATVSIATTATTSRSSPTRLFDELRDEHGLGERDRLLLQVASLLHDVGIYVSLRAHHKHSQYILAASQIFGLSDEETADRLEHRPLPSPRVCRSDTHLPFIALDRDRPLIVNKLAAILRVANALDAEHAQKVRDLRAGSPGQYLGRRARRGPAT